MTRFLLLTVAALGAASIAGATTLRITLGDAVVSPAPDVDYADGMYPLRIDASEPNPTVYGVWAEIDFDSGAGVLDQWDAVGIDLAWPSGVAIETSMLNRDYDPAPFGTALRWEDGADFGGVSGATGAGSPDFALINVTRAGLGGLPPAGLPGGAGVVDDDAYYDAAQRRVFYLLGTLTVDPSSEARGDVFLRHNGAAFDPSGDPDRRIVIGPNGPFPIEPIVPPSEAPLITIVPEPAAVVGLLLAGLLVRRRLG